MFFSSSLDVIVEFFLILSKSPKDKTAISAKLDFFELIVEFFAVSDVKIKNYFQIF
jgi:hypothetical protein